MAIMDHHICLYSQLWTVSSHQFFVFDHLSDALRYLDDFSSFHPPSGQKTMKAGARLSMAVDVLAMLIMVVFIGALLLAPSRRDGKAQH